MHRRAVSVAEAQALIAPHAMSLPPEHVPLAATPGRYLAADVNAPHPFPPFRRAGMDGFAVRSIDVAAAAPAAPVRLRVVADVPCGALPPEQLGPGEAARTMTGAMVAQGADAVIPLEVVEASADGLFVDVIGPVAAGLNVTEAGSERALGERLLRQGSRIGPGEIAVLAACGLAEVPVWRAPVVAIVSTGSELLAVDSPFQPGKIRDSNAPLLAALVRQAGGVPLLVGRTGDDLAAVRETMAGAFQVADTVISTGGVSVGDYDVLADLFLEWEGKTLFNKVAMRPGSPTTVGVLHGKLWFGLSGNPASCFVGFHLLVRPALLALQGSVRPYPGEMTAVLADDCPGGGDFTRFVRGRLLCGADGRVLVRPAGPDRSSAVTSLIGVDCLIGVGPGDGTPLRAGRLVPVLRLE
jgi:molybdopterin molybdotransferase